MTGVFSYVAAGVMLLWLVPAGGALAQPLERELEALLKSHPEIEGRRNAAAAAQGGVDRAYARYLPRLDVNGGVGPRYIDSPVTKRASGGQWVSVAQLAGVNLSETLFDGFATPARVQSAVLKREEAEFALAETRQRVLFEGIRAYVDVLRQRRLVELASTSERTIKRQLHLEDERVQRGAGIAVDVLQAKSRLQVAKEQRVAFQGALREAISRYIQIFGKAPQVDEMVEPNPPVDFLPGDLDTAIQVAADENPTVAGSLATVAEARERRRLAAADYYPKIDLVAAANYEKDNELVEGVRTDLSLLLRTTWNLFDGFATSSGVTQATFDYRASRNDHETVARKTSETIRTAWYARETAEERRTLLENAMTIAEAVFNARRKLREAGRETVINVLDAENELYKARMSLTIARADAILATYRLLAGLGRLDVRHLALASD